MDYCKSILAKFEDDARLNVSKVAFDQVDLDGFNAITAEIDKGAIEAKTVFNNLEEEDDDVLVRNSIDSIDENSDDIQFEDKDGEEEVLAWKVLSP